MTKFVRPENIHIGDLVWYFHLDSIIGPLLVVDLRTAGYGSNGHQCWIMFDSITGDYHQAGDAWIRIPKEKKCNHG